MNYEQYYMNVELYEPPDMKHREFGFRQNGSNMIRHKSFHSTEELRHAILIHRPHHVYFSIAKYEYPDLYPMSAKKDTWIGSDLIFDIDDEQLKKQTLKEAKKQSLELINIMENNFGFKDIMYTESGRRGFHVHIRDKCIQKIDDMARREIINYVGHYAKRNGRKVINPNWVQIDAPVSINFTRLIRLPTTLNISSNNKVGICRIIEY